MEDQGITRAPGTRKRSYLAGAGPHGVSSLQLKIEHDLHFNDLLDLKFKDPKQSESSKDFFNNLFLENRLVNQETALLKKVQKSIDKTHKNSIKIVKSSKLNSINQEGISNALIFSIILDLSSNVTTPEQFIRGFINSKFFQSYEFCQLIYHQKGNPVAYSLSAKNGSEVQTSNTEVKHFNDLYRIVNKSRNKIFDNSNLNLKQVETNGNFLATESSFSDYSFIFLISGGGFLKYTKFEIETFTKIINGLSTLIYDLISGKELQKETITNSKILEFLKVGFQLTKKDDVIYTSPYYSNDITSTSHSLSDGLNLNVNDVNDVKDKALFHLQKINLLGELLNTLRHELNNPVFGIKMICQVLSGDEQIKDPFFINEISNNCTRCQEIIRNFSQLYQTDIEYQVVNLKKLITETLTLVKSESKAISKSIIFSNGLDENFEIEINPTWLSQIIFNLLINSLQAMKNMPANQQKLEIFVGKKDDCIAITINDNGPGIHEEVAHNFFDPFVTTKTNGTGLGLSICKDLAKKMKGDVIHNHDFKNGTSFIIELGI